MYRPWRPQFFKPPRPDRQRLGLSGISVCPELPQPAAEMAGKFSTLPDSPKRCLWAIGAAKAGTLPKQGRDDLGCFLQIKLPSPYFIYSV